MTTYFCDGSQKGMGIGAGVVKVDDYGFLEMNHYEKIHPQASSLLAETFAIYQTLNIAESNEEEKIVIYTDCLELVEYAKHNVVHKNGENIVLFGVTEREELLLMKALRNKIAYLYYSRKVKELSIYHYDKNNEEQHPYMNIAHIASREYIQNVPSFFLNDTEVIKVDHKKNKEKLNKKSLSKEDEKRMTEQEFLRKMGRKEEENKRDKETQVKESVPTIEFTYETINPGKSTKKWKLETAQKIKGEQMVSVHKNLAKALHKAITEIEEKLETENIRYQIPERLYKTLQVVERENQHESIQEQARYVMSRVEMIPQENLLLL